MNFRFLLVLCELFWYYFFLYFPPAFILNGCKTLCFISKNNLFRLSSHLLSAADLYCLLLEGKGQKKMVLPVCVVCLLSVCWQNTS